MRVQSDHWAIIVDFCEQHPQLITNKFNGVGGRNELNELWKKLTIRLNSLGFGEKTVEGWKKTITDWKSKSKAKAGAIKSHSNKTGGGTHSNLVLTSYEERLLMIMGKTCYEGNSENIERGIRKRKLFDDHLEETVTEVPLAAVHSYNTNHTYPVTNTEMTTQNESFIMHYELPVENETIILTDQMTTNLSNRLPDVRSPHVPSLPSTSSQPFTACEKRSNTINMVPINSTRLNRTATYSSYKDLPKIHISSTTPQSTPKVNVEHPKNLNITPVHMVSQEMTPRKSNVNKQGSERRNAKKDSAGQLQGMHKELITELRNINTNINSIAESLKLLVISLNK